MQDRPHRRAAGSSTARAHLLLILASSLVGCSEHSDSLVGPDPLPDARYTIEQTLSDEAQRNTIAFDGLAFLTGNLGSQSFPERRTMEDDDPRRGTTVGDDRRARATAAFVP